MYVVKYGTRYLHDPFSDKAKLSDISLSAQINASGDCSFTMAPNHPLYNDIQVRSLSDQVFVMQDNTILFDGYISGYDDDFDGTRTVTCSGCLSYLGDVCLRPYSTIRDPEDGSGVLYAPESIDGMFEFYISQYNEYADSSKQFLVGKNEGAVLSTSNQISVESSDFPTVADEITDVILDQFGGYLFVRHSGSKRYIDLFSECVDVNAQIVDFGVNILDFTKSVDLSDFYTAIRPSATVNTDSDDKAESSTDIDLTGLPDNESPYPGLIKKGDVLYNQEAVEKYGYVEYAEDFGEVADVNELVEKAASDLKAKSKILPTIEVKAIDLSLYQEGNTPLVPGQLVRIRSVPHGVDEYMLLNAMDIDVSDPSQTTYTFGVPINTLTGEQSKRVQELNANINHSLDAVGALDQATKDQAVQIGNIEQVANDASEKADNAQNTANNAQNTADNAQNTANSNKEAINSIKDAQTEYEKQLEQMQAGVDQAEKEIDGINDRLDQMDTEAGEVQASIDAVRQEAQTNFETAKAAADAAQAKADAVGADLESFRTETGESIQNVKDSVSGVRSDVDAVTQKAADLASELDGTKATVEQVTTDLGEVKTTVSNAATKADQALQVSTSASQTATEAKTTATSAYQDAQSALTQSSTASQTANAVKTELETKYSTTDEIAEQYATKSLVEQTSQSITSTVEATYATKATVEALENIANNAVQTWMGSGVPTLSNKPASDWTTAELKSQHSGDIYYDTDTGYSYRFGSSDGKNYSWSLIKDTDIAKAVADAAKAQQTAEGVSDEVTQLKTDIPATYATKTEVKQTTDSIKSSVSEVATTANSALSKATTVEQTAKGLQTTVTEQAEKLDGAVTTISQVSQRVDSVSSTITQVSGRVDDVEDKADAAQGTANSALSQASRVEQSLDSFKTSVSRDYQTKTDALSQKSELEQNINSFKTTVSETYTTKDEFNALEIGGTNLIKGSKPYGKSGFFEHFNSVTDNEYGELTLQSTTTSQSYPNVPLYYSDTFTFDKTDIVTGDKYVISYDIMMLERTYTASSTFTENWIGIRHSGGNWSGLIKYDGIKNDFLSAPLNEWAHFEHSITANAWDGTTVIGANIQLGTRSVGKFRFRMRNVKLEKGTKATAWSPAPEDFDGKYTSKTEFKQTTDKISATATAASQNASSALSKVGSLEVSVDGIDTRVEEVASDADEAVKTASQVSQRVDSLSSTITQVSKLVDGSLAQQYLTNPDFETGDDTGWTFTNFSNHVVNTVSPYTGKYKVYVQPPTNGNPQTIINSKVFTVTPGQRFRLSAAINADNPTTKAATLGLVNSEDASKFITGTINVDSSSYKTYSTTITIPSGWSKAQFRFATVDTGYRTMRLDSFMVLDVSAGLDAQDVANSALSKSSSVEQNLNSFKTSVSQTYETKSDASSKQSSLQQSVNNLRTEVSETYLTKTSAQQTYSTKSYVDQTARTVSLGVVEEYKKGQHGSALATQSDITAAKDSITSTVSQTYATKNDVGVGNLIKNGDFSDGTSNWSTNGGTSKIVDGTYGKQFVFTQTGTNTNGSNRIYNSSYSHINGQAYEISFYAKADKSSKWHFGPNNSPKAASVTLDTTLKQYTIQYQADGTTVLSIWTDNPTATIYLERVKLSVASGYYATKTEVKQTSDSLTVTISSAVSKAESAATAASNAQNIANAANSTANTAKNNAATAQNTANTAKTNAATAQSTADKANSNAQNAQNRVGNLETCIKMTSDGVRVGKISNGNFTGYSALVNSAGSFDVLDQSGTPISRFTASGITFSKSLSIESDSIRINDIPMNRDNSLDRNLSLDGWNIQIQHMGYITYRIRVSQTRNFGTSMNGYVAGTLPYTFYVTQSIGLMHVGGAAVNVFEMYTEGNRLHVRAPQYNNTVSYEVSIIAFRSGV